MYCLCSLARSLAAELVNRLIEKVVLASPRAVVHADDVQQGRLSGPRRPHDGDEFPLLHVQVDAAEHVRAARAVGVRFLDIAQRDERVRGQGLAGELSGCRAGWSISRKTPWAAEPFFLSEVLDR